MNVLIDWLLASLLIYLVDLSSIVLDPLLCKVLLIDCCSRSDRLMSCCLIAEFAVLLWGQIGTSTKQAHNHLKLHMSVKNVYG